MIVRFVGYTWVLDLQDEDGDPISDANILKTLDGLSYDDSGTLADYIFDGADDVSEGLAGITFSGGRFRCEYDEAANCVNYVTEYSTDRDLTDDQIRLLREYTESQWNEGVGANFAQFFPEDRRYWPSLAAWGDKIKTFVNDEARSIT